jgi:hypothetical protein
LLKNLWRLKTRRVFNRKITNLLKNFIEAKNQKKKIALAITHKRPDPLWGGGLRVRWVTQVGGGGHPPHLTIPTSPMSRPMSPFFENKNEVYQSFLIDTPHPNP